MPRFDSAPDDPRTRLKPYGPVLSIAPRVVVETENQPISDEPVIRIRFDLSWT